MDRIYFGTDGVRGPYGGPIINEEFVARLGAAVVAWLRGSGEDVEAGSVGQVLIGRDTRASGAALEVALAAGLRSAGATPISLGVLPTPAVALATNASGARLGVVITASHNPACDNGIKFFGPHGVKLTDEDEAIIEGFLKEGIEFSAAEPIEVSDQAVTDYIRSAGNYLPAGALNGWEIALDTANGATSKTSPEVLRGLGAEVIGIGDSPDGTNINAEVGSEHPELLAQKVKECGARLGVAHDGDGDRCILCDENGSVLDGDEVLTLLAVHAIDQNRLPNKTLVVTVYSNLGVDAAVKARGGEVLRTPVGDRYVIEKMHEVGAELGGESSGHIICGDTSTTGDGLMAALKAIEVMHSTGLPLSELRKVLVKFPQASVALNVKEERDFSDCPQLTLTIAALEQELGTEGRLLVRYSGTESKLRLLIEGPTDAVVAAGMERLKTAANADLTIL
ncbi:MAG: phosphoglucosamine mutase [Opitutaceae bacterium]|nr:phosphoglucosamine mutase [Opitutaceae bacterium]